MIGTADCQLGLFVAWSAGEVVLRGAARGPTCVLIHEIFAPESRFDSSLATLGVPRSRFSSIHARCSRAALDMHEFMLQCYYQIRGRNAERLQVDKAMLTSTPLGGIARLSPRHVISR